MELKLGPDLPLLVVFGLCFQKLRWNYVWRTVSKWIAIGEMRFFFCEFFSSMSFFLFSLLFRDTIMYCTMSENRHVNDFSSYRWPASENKLSALAKQHSEWERILLKLGHNELTGLQRTELHHSIIYAIIYRRKPPYFLRPHNWVRLNWSSAEKAAQWRSTADKMCSATPWPFRIFLWTRNNSGVEPVSLGLWCEASLVTWEWTWLEICYARNSKNRVREGKCQLNR